MYVRALVLLDGGISTLCALDLVLCAGAVVLIVGLYIYFLSLCLATVDCATLRNTGVDIVDKCWVCCVIDIDWHELLLLLFSGTFKLSGSHAVVVGVIAIYDLWWIAFPVIWKSCFILSDTFLLPKFLMDLAQYYIAAITLSACVMVVRVSFLLLKCTVYVNRSLLVGFMWHLYAR